MIGHRMAPERRAWVIIKTWAGGMSEEVVWFPAGYTMAEARAELRARGWKLSRSDRVIPR